MALIQTLAPDPGADLAAQAQLMRQQKLAQLLANPPAAPEIDMGGDGGGKSDKSGSPEGNSILARALSEDVAKTAGPSVASFDAPVSTGSFTAPISISSGGGGKAHFSLNDDQRRELSTSIRATAQSLGVSPEHVAAIMSFETGGTLNPWQPGPRTKWGQHHGLIQWGEPQAKQYGVGPNSSIPDQVAAVGRYLTDHGVRPGMGLNNLYSAVLHGNANSGLDVTDANGTSANSGAANMQRTAHINALANLERGFGGQSQAPQFAPAETPYKVASLGFQPPPRRQPISPMQPATAPAPAPAPTTQPPPIPTMVGAPMPTSATPISGAALTDAPMPPSRSANGVDDMIKRQAAASRPAFSAPQEFDLFDEIGRGLEELFGGGGDTGDGGPSPQQLGTQLASAGEEYYPMQPTTGHGIIGNLLTDAFREPVPIPQEVRALANSPKQSDRLAYQLMVHGDQLGSNQSAMMTALYKEAREREQAVENQWSGRQVDAQGHEYQIDRNGQIHPLNWADNAPKRQTAVVDGNVIDTQTGQIIFSAPQKPPAPTATIQDYEYVKQHPEAAGYFTKTRVPDTENTAEIKNFKYAQQNPEFAKSLQRGPSLTPDAITFYGEQVARGDMSPLQNLGRGAQGAENVTAIRNAAVAFAQKNGMDPRAIMEASAGYLGEKAGARTLGTNEANAINAGVEAMNALKLGRETNAKLPRGQFYPVNKAIQAYQFGTSDPNLAAYGQAVATIANTYARAVNPKGLPHEAVVSDTLRRLNAAQGPDALNAIFDIMQKEIEMAQRAPSQARDVLKGNREGTKAPSGKTSKGLNWSIEEEQ